MLVGLAGVVLSILSGILVAWLGLFVFAIDTGFERISVAAVVVFFILTVFTSALDFAAPMLGARRYKASKFGVLGAFLGSLVGLFVLAL